MIKILQFLFLSLLLLTISSGIFSLWLSSEVGQQYVNKKINQIIVENSDYEVKIKALSYSLPCTLKAKEIKLIKHDKELISINKALLKIDLNKLLYGHLYIRNLSAKKLHIIDIDDVIEQDKKSDASFKIAYLDNFDYSSISEKIIFLRKITIDNANIDRLTFSNKVFDIGNNYIYTKLSGIFDIINGNIDSELKIAIGENNDKKNVKEKFTLKSDLNINFEQLSANIQNLIAEIADQEVKISADINYKDDKVKLHGLSKSLSNSAISQNLKLSLEGALNNISMNLQGDMIFKNYINKTSDVNNQAFILPKLEYNAHGTIIDLLKNNLSMKGDFKVNQGYFHGEGPILLSKNNFKLGKIIFKKSEVSNSNDQEKILKKSSSVKNKNEKYFALNYDFNKANLLIDLNLNSVDMTEFNQYVPLLVHGNGKLKATYELSEYGARLELLGDIKKIHAYDLHIDELNFDTESAHNKALVKKDLYSKNSIPIKSFILKAKNFTHEHIHINKANIKGVSNKDNINLDFNILSNFPRIINVNGIASINILKQGLETKIKELKGKIEGENIKINNELVFLFSDNKQKININDLRIGKGHMNFIFNNQKKFNKEKGSNSFNKRSNNLIMDFQATDLPTKILGELDQQDLSSSYFNSKIHFDNNEGKAEAELEFDARNIKIKKYSTSGQTVDSEDVINNVKLNGSIKKDILNFNIKLNKNTQNLAVVTGNIPVSLKLNDEYDFNIENNKQFNTKLVIVEKFNIISLLKMPIGHKLAGLIQGSLELGGTLNNPNVYANLFLSDGKYSFKQAGVKLKDISARITSKGQKINCSKIKLGDGYGKYITGEGYLNINDPYPFEFKLLADDHHLFSSSYMQGNVSGSLNIKGDNKKCDIRGDVVVGPLDIKIPQKINQKIPTVNIVKVYDNGHMFKNKNNQNSYDLNLYIDAHAGKKVSVTGWGVNTQLKGDIKIKGNADDLELKGKLTSVHGKFEEFGRKMKITEGELIFDGPIPPSPFLNIVGSSNVGSYEIKLVLGGSISDPKLDIQSNPEIGDEEAMSLLLFGDDPQNISALQGLQLASSVRRLSGKSDSVDLIDVSKKAIGVDEIIVKQEGTTKSKSTVVGVGKHISDKLFLQVEQSTEDGPRVTVEMELTQKISIDGTTSGSGNNNVGINWRYDY